jgi:high-affinity iron transporter
MSALMYYGLLAIPAHKLFRVTAGLITLLAAGMAAQAVLFLQNAGYLQVLMTPVWDTSWLLPQDSIVGRMLHALVGYSDAPDGAQIAAYAVTIVAITLLMRWEHGRHPRKQAVPLPAE